MEFRRLLYVFLCSVNDILSDSDLVCLYVLSHFRRNRLCSESSAVNQGLSARTVTSRDFLGACLSTIPLEYHCKIPQQSWD